MAGVATAAPVAARNLRREAVIAVLPEHPSLSCKQGCGTFQCSGALSLPSRLEGPCAPGAGVRLRCRDDWTGPALAAPGPPWDVERHSHAKAHKTNVGCGIGGRRWPV